MIVKLKEKIEMDNATGGVSAWKPIMLSNDYTKEQLEQEIKNRQLEKKLLLNSIKVKGYEILIDSIRSVWVAAGASDDVIECRISILKEDYENDQKLTIEQRKEKVKDLDIYKFEKNLAKEVIEKAGIDVQYEKDMRLIEYLKKNHEVKDSDIRMPEKKTPENVELSSNEEITKFIRNRVKAFYDRTFNYPEEKEVETIGV